ncbi:methyltransferase domain-containing protein [Microbacterium trichothecenolyticum]|uniref:methyltransferase domain-containing protein n=1 Tax=Microbacterium trichothecenolyticum TaxID=69370 RepID=UPI001C6EAB53|nr:methyltransferase domain-containing protein [Microbacterium trichothecenolyticum]MBW9119594.1 methyltransferase domain-containing protein [Microbacterium trichothecenolyticum]
MEQEVEFFTAMRAVVTPLVTASALLQVIDRAERAGMLRELREGSDTTRIAGATGLPLDTVVALCGALVANGIAEPVADGFRLTPDWRAITGGGAFVSLADMIAQSRVIDAMLSGRESAYASLSPEDRSTFAHAVSPNPYSPELVERIRAEIAASPWWSGMTEGGRHLELGCGVAGRMLTVLQAMPRLRAVGVELDPALAEEARRRASDLGIRDRIEIVTGDATTYRTDEPFDFGFWSQWFFPTPTREAALASLFANVRSGGVVRSPVFGDHGRMADDLHGDEARQYSLNRVMLDGWGVPERTPEQLKAEFEDAGFIDVTIVYHDINDGIYARRP